MPVIDFLKRLEGVIDPEMKRKIIGEEFIRGVRGGGKEKSAKWTSWHKERYTPT